jgi:hypothetical protein
LPILKLIRQLFGGRHIGFFKKPVVRRKLLPLQFILLAKFVIQLGTDLSSVANHPLMVEGRGQETVT